MFIKDLIQSPMKVNRLPLASQGINTPASLSATEHRTPRTVVLTKLSYRTNYLQVNCAEKAFKNIPDVAKYYISTN